MAYTTPTAGHSKASHPDSISFPLYLSGFAVTWAGIEAVSSQLSNDPFMTTTTALVVLGFVFSLAARWANIDSRVINAIPAVIGVYFVVRYFEHTFTAAAMLPVEAQQSGDMAIAVVLVWVSVIRSWMLITDTSVVFSAVTSIAMIGLVGAFNVNTDLIIYFFVYVVSALYLVVHQNYLVHRTWLGGEASLLTDLSVLRTHIFLCVTVGLVSLLLGTVLLVPVKMLGSHLSLAAAVRFYYNPGGDPTKATVEYSDDPKFAIGGGDGYTASDAIVMVASPSDHQPHYWRGRSYDEYTRHGWSSTLTSPAETLQPVPINRDGTDLYTYEIHRYASVEGPQIDLSGSKKGGASSKEWELFTRVRIVGGRTTTLYAPGRSREIVVTRPLDTDLLESRDGGVAFDTLVDRLEYYVVSDNNEASVARLRKAEFGGIPQAIRMRYIDPHGQGSLSADEQNRLSATAHGIVNSLPTNQHDLFDEASAIQGWVGRRCLYDLNVDPVPEDQDAVSYFLYESRRGYCDLFASSMALLCRYDGIPARVVTGFAPGTANQDGGFDVRARDKHAWVEVYVPGAGWCTMDPTIDATSSDTERKSHDLIYYFREMVAALTRFFNLNGPVPLILFGVIIVSLAYVVKVEVFDRLRLRWRRMHRVTALRAGMTGESPDEIAVESARQLAADRYRRMERGMACAGIPRPRHFTPAAFEAMVRERLPAQQTERLPAPATDIVDAVSRLTADYIIASYAPSDEAQVLLDMESAEQADRSAALMDLVARKNWYQGWRLGTPRPSGTR